MTNKCKRCGEWDKYPKTMRPCYPGFEHDWTPLKEGEMRTDLDELHYLRGALLYIAKADPETDAKLMRYTAQEVLENTGFLPFAELKNGAAKFREENTLITETEQ